MTEENNTQETKGFTPVPYGEYPAKLKEASVVPFKNGNGRKIAMKFEIETDDGPRLVFHDMTDKNKKSKKAEEYGRRGADMFLKAIGLENGLEDVDHDIQAVMDYTDTPLVLAVTVKKGGEEYINKDGEKAVTKDRNIVVAFKRA